MVEEFLRIRQESSVGEYHDKFEDLRVRRETLKPGLEEPYFLSVFIGSLRDNIRPMVEKSRKPKHSLKPINLTQ